MTTRPPPIRSVTANMPMGRLYADQAEHHREWRVHQIQWLADGGGEHIIVNGTMDYEIFYQPTARATLDRMSPDVARRILRKVDRLRHDLADDVKRLKAFVPEYRLRVGDWRVLFDVHGATITIHDIKHRSQAYD